MKKTLYYFEILNREVKTIRLKASSIEDASCILESMIEDDDEILNIMEDSEGYSYEMLTSVLIEDSVFAENEFEARGIIELNYPIASITLVGSYGYDDYLYDEWKNREENYI